MEKRIIPCLDIKNGKTVKGVNFINLKQAGDPIELAQAYNEQGADELVILDIAATVEKRKTFGQLINDIANVLTIPLTVGGGISELADVERILESGASKVSYNTAALRNPDLIDDVAKHFGSEVSVIAIDAKQTEKGWMCLLDGGNTVSDRTLLDWAYEAQERGAGEILFTSMDHDGKKIGFPNDMLAQLKDKLSIPIIASGGAGSMEDFKDAFVLGKVDAALAASVFHFGEIKIPELKAYLCEQGISVKK
ncbi:MAG: imidazole glycerol phosphate synthase subunit HisF [Bacteroides sp.]|nr:imidazole glycerol phosphate synthase subunit HisF [Bacteroides sp.]MDD4719856.1 imidazole glycerol phosphate synthase subunit HisF [Bacteroides sp.]NLI63877.1 imidazole glycerol phosphate synthase subunit HisF [Bacteroidales bacterium]